MIPVNVTVSTVPTTISIAAQKALENRLYQNQCWMFYDLLQRPTAIIKLATAFWKRKRIGVAIYWDYELLEEFAGDGYERQVGCFVREEFRRQNVGSQLIERIRVPKDVKVGQGLAISRDFWAQVKPEAEFQ